MKQIKGYIRAGPDFTQNFQGWKVYAQRQDTTDMPVTIVIGHQKEKTHGAN